MLLELKPEQQQMLERAAQSGMSAEEVLDQAFAVIREQFQNEDWMQAERETVAAHIAEGFRQADQGQLLDGEDAAKALKTKRAHRS
jgi:hypothetical protein